MLNNNLKYLYSDIRIFGCHNLKMTEKYSLKVFENIYL